MRGLIRSFVVCVVSVLLLASGGMLRAADKADKKADAPKKQPDYYQLMKEFVTVFEQIERNYVKDIDRRELMEAAIDGMIKKLDPYSSYIGPEKMEEFNRDVEQRFGGIGIQVRINPENKRLTVMTPLPGTPAYKAGIQPGDIIEKIEGQSTKGFTIEDAVKLLKGKPGEPVAISVRHAGSNKVEKVRLVRAIIEIDTVRGDYYNADGTWNFFIDPKKKIGYIRLTHFSRHSGDEMQEALKTLKHAGMKGLILDLRNNPGGLLSQATEIADLFIDEGRIVSVKGKNTPERVWEATKSGTYSGFPMAVLVNRYSASASEILSACLQDHDRAVIVGERTWGKGSVQNVIRIEKGSSALKLTTASYHRPSGHNIHRFPGAKESDEWGVMPDKKYRIRFTTSELLKYHEYRRNRDVASKNGPPEESFKDRQLKKALEYVAAKIAGKDDTGDKDNQDGKDDKKPNEKKKDKAAGGTKADKDSTSRNGKTGGAAVNPEPRKRRESSLRSKLRRLIPLLIPRVEAA